MLKEKMKEIVKYLRSNTDYNKDEIIMIINPLETPNQAEMLLDWIKQQQEPMRYSIMRKKAKEIVEKN